MTDSPDVPLREWLAGQFDRLDDRISELKSDHADRLDTHERMLIGNGQEGIIQRAVRNSARLQALENVVGPHLAADHGDKKKDRISLAGIASVVAAVVAGIVTGLSGRTQ